MKEETYVLHRPRDRIGIVEIAFDDLDLQIGEIDPGARWANERADLMSGFHQTSCDRRTDEPAGASHQDHVIAATRCYRRASKFAAPSGPHRQSLLSSSPYSALRSTVMSACPDLLLPQPTREQDDELEPAGMAELPSTHQRPCHAQLCDLSFDRPQRAADLARSRGGRSRIPDVSVANPDRHRDFCLRRFLCTTPMHLWSIYIRRSLRLSRWEWGQLALGLCIPVLLMSHVVSTRIAESVLDVNSYYSTILIVQWLMFPWLGAVQFLAVLTVWIHACIGIHFWLRTKTWYPNWRPLFFGFALLLPTLALAGFITAGNQILREGKNPDYAKSSLEDSNLTDQAIAAIWRMVVIGWSLHLGLGGGAVRRPRHSRLALSPPPAAAAVSSQRAHACRSWLAPPCSRRCAKTASRMHRCAAAGRAARRAACW